MPAVSFVPQMSAYRVDNQDFRAYLEQSLRDPFTINLSGCSLLEVIRACMRAKSRQHPNYPKSLGSLVYNLTLLEEQYKVSIQPIQVTDVFWGYFISFCQNRGIKNSSITTMTNQLRAVLNWATRYNVTVSPTYSEVSVSKVRNQEIALTADEVSRIAYFDIDRFYANRKSSFRRTMHQIRDMFVLSCNLYQRHSDMVRIQPSCFDRNVFKITQQKTGNLAVVNIDRYSIDASTTYRILEQYGYTAPYKGTIGNYNYKLHGLMKDIGFTEEIRVEDRVNGQLVVKNIPKWKLISSHTARRTAITVNVLRGHNIHSLRRCSGHTDLRTFDGYVRDE